MSFAVIQSGGKQYKVKSGEILKIERLPDSKENSKIEFKDILAYGDNKIIEIGTPIIQGAKVEADLLKNKINEIKSKLKRNLPTIPSTIKDELECNVFLRAKDLENFSKLRDLKDNF